MLIAIGTAREQWRDAGIEVYFGRLSAQGLHELGSRLLDADTMERVREESLAKEVEELKRQLEDAADWEEVSELEDDVVRLSSQVEDLEAERDELKKQVAALERTIRGQAQTITELESRR